MPPLPGSLAHDLNHRVLSAIAVTRQPKANFDNTENLWSHPKKLTRNGLLLLNSGLFILFCFDSIARAWKNPCRLFVRCLRNTT